jgi:CRISPR-associated protein Cas2
MRAKKIFTVVAYDIESDKIRNKVAEILQMYGERANKSVFECMFSETQLKKTKQNIASLINEKTDSVIFYRICVNCYTKTEYLPLKSKHFSVVTIV